MAEKYEVIINNQITLTADGMGWEYPQTDGEGSGATDENLMFREVLPERDKITLRFEWGKTEAEIRTILAVRAMEECQVNFYDLRAGERLTKTMYPVSDTINASLMADGEFVCEPFELRFIQTVPN
ncbi:MAG: hypothetical protein IJ261_03545 [Clostridia bacterium]|nr:hypothetical protein [Clostridia bacterium]